MEEQHPTNTDELERNIERLNALIPRLAAALAARKARDPRLEAPDQKVYAEAAAAYFSEMLNDPSRLIEAQVGYWSESLKNWADIQKRVLQDEAADEGTEQRADRRFSSEHWRKNAYFDLIKRQYLLSSKTISSVTGGLTDLDDRQRNRVDFFTRQIVDMLSPTNFLATNPEALDRAIQSDGRSLVDGLENFVRDLEANPEGHAVMLSDPDAFAVGKDLATTEGSVVFQNRIFQLIQYAPRTRTVYRAPLLILPPWINKYYILDLRPDNSLIRHAVEAGHTVFVVSWVNPDASLRAAGLETYLEEGFLAALDTVLEITGESAADVVGYCIGGTLLACGLAFLAAGRGPGRVRKATFLTTMTDFEHPGDLGVFIEESFLDGIRKEVEEKGFMPAFLMSRTFSYLRSNDLVYGPAVRAYLLGEKPPAFDLLHWNGDSTNLPARMAVEYLERLYRDNDLANGRFELSGRTLRIPDIEVPLFAVATIADHIAPWKSSFAGLARAGGEKTFVLAESGHIAGIVNPPSRKKYGHWTNAALPEDPEEWHSRADFHAGSWWPRWSAWLTAGETPDVAARHPGSDAHPEIERAPGSYVLGQAGMRPN